ncbi:MAG: choice-of-anchor B family protein [Planctomycetes bacterium]|nr:choice-of-anchor B family protein [Planctomycetota bacterium]
MRSAACVSRVSGLAVALLSAAVAVGHPGHGAELDAQRPWDGEGFSVDNDTPPPLTFPSNNVQLLSWTTLSQLSPGSTSGNTCWGYVSPSGREYAIIGTSNATVFVEVTNPAAPNVVARIPGATSLWRDMKTYQNYCYAVSEGGGGVQIMNLSNIDAGSVTLVGSVNTPDTSATHTIHINEASGFLCRCGGQGFTNGPGGVRVYSLANPAAPAFVGQWTTRYVHEAQVVSYTTGPYAGKEIAFCYANNASGGGSPAVDILDVTNKSAIVRISQAFYANAAFSHQGWLSPDRQYLYLNDELDEDTFGLPTLTRIFNVSNLNAPALVGTFGNGGGAIDHNLYTLGNRIFQSNYRSGLRVFDATNPTAPTEVAFFDTYPDNDSPNFNGLWNNYPFFPSGIVIGSDIEKGLFVWWVGPQQLSFATTPANPNPFPFSAGVMRVQIAGVGGATVQPGTVQLRYLTSDTSTWASLPMTESAPGQYQVTLPALPCGGTMQYYFAAKANNNVQFRYPTTTFSADIGSVGQVAFSDNFETSLGWSTFTPGDNATSGTWVRVDPVGTAAQSENDNPGGVGTLCYVTGQGAVGGGLGDADVDGGTTTLTSPLLDATAPLGDPYVVYSRWYSNNQGGAPNADSMPIQISNDDGATWVLLEDVAENAGQWVTKQWRIGNYVIPTNRMRVRFVARDLGSGSVVEAGVDDVQIKYISCSPPPACPGDFNASGAVDTADLVIFLGVFGATVTPGAPGDLDTNGVINTADLVIVLGNFGLTCP